MKNFMMLIMICLIINFILYLALKSNKDKEKLSSFECGFDSFLKPRSPFSIRFFKILLIFLLFDMEIIILIPIPFNMMQITSFYIFIFMMILIIMMGLIFEWKEGSLEWI